MDSARFDQLTRTVSTLSSRRTFAGALGLGALAMTGLTDAKKKRKRKKKKKNKDGGGVQCQSGETNCDGQCFNLNTNAQHCGGCNARCGTGAACTNGICNCNSGFKVCNGTCIPEGNCCGGCLGDTICNGGECVCPEDAPHECPGGECLTIGNCCNTSQCPASKECVDGICLCPGPEAINCTGTLCCDGAADEVCNLVPGTPTVASCQAGGCPPTDFCTDRATEQFVCAGDPGRVCVCTSTVDLIPGKVCVDLILLVDQNNPCEECDTSSDCGSGRVCISGGDGCVCSVNFCVNLCPEVTVNRAKDGTDGTPVDLEALNGGLASVQLPRDGPRRKASAPVAAVTP